MPQELIQSGESELDSDYARLTGLGDLRAKLYIQAGRENAKEKVQKLIAEHPELQEYAGLSPTQIKAKLNGVDFGQDLF